MKAKMKTSAKPKTSATCLRLPLHIRNLYLEWGRHIGHGTLNGSIQAAAYLLVQPAIAAIAAADQLDK